MKRLSLGLLLFLVAGVWAAPSASPSQRISTAIGDFGFTASANEIHADRSPAAATNPPANARTSALLVYDAVEHVPGVRTSGASGFRAAKAADEGIYVIKGAQETYVGQSGNVANRLAQHVKSGRFTQREVDAAETGRGGSTIHFGPDNHVSVVVGRNGRVVTVGYGRFKP